MSTLLETLGLQSVKDNFAIVGDNPDAVKSQSSTVRLVKGKRVRIPGSINGVKYPTYATLESAYWTRLTIRNHEVRRQGEETRISQVFGGIFKPTKIKVEMEIGGKLWSLEDIVAQCVVDSSAPGATKEEILKNVQETGITDAFRDGMSVFFQQMGASVNGMQHAVEVFKAAGAIDDMESVRNNPRFHTCYDMKSKQGLEVVSFELGSADREQSKTGQGFIDIPDAVISNLIRVLGNKKTIAVLTQQNENGGLSQEQIKANSALIDANREMSRQYPTTWTGASKQINTLPSGDTVAQNKYNATNAPCGRWTVVTANGNVDLDVWSNSNTKPSNAAPVAQVDTTKAPF